MANPSLKNGYISIAHELVEKLAMINVPGNEMRIIWVVLRKTWGWKEGDRKKDWDWISYSQFEKATGMKHMSVGKCLKSLVGKRLLLKSEKGLKFNQNHDEWVVGKKLPPVVKRLLPSRQTATKIGRQTATHNRKKETNTKETRKASQSDAELISKTIASFEEVNPNYSRWYGNTTQRGAIDRLLVLHGFETLVQVISLLPKTNARAYFPTITTPTQLENDWARLESKLKQEKDKQLTRGRGLA